MNLDLGNRSAERCAEDLRYAKVGDLDAALAVEQQILRFDVPMHHAAVMRELEPLAEPAPDNACAKDERRHAPWQISTQFDAPSFAAYFASVLSGSGKPRSMGLGMCTWRVVRISSKKGCTSVPTVSIE